MKVKIEIDTKTFVRFWLVVIGFALAGLLIYNARTALIIIGAAAFLALALNGPVSWLASKLPNRSRALGTAISFVAIVTIISSILFLAVPPIVEQTAKFVDTLPETTRSLSGQWKAFGDFVNHYNLESQIAQLSETFQNNVTSWVANFGQNFISGVGATLSMIASMFLVLVLTILMLIEAPNWTHHIWKLYSDEEKMKKHRRIANRMNSVVSGYVGGQLAVSGLDGVLAGLTVYILSLLFPEVASNLALPTIAIMFIMSLIPMFGATIGGMLVIGLLALNSLPAAIIFAIYFVVYQQIENNVIAPAIQSKRVDLSPLMVLMAVTIGLYMFGLIGGVISIPIAGCLKVIADEYIKIDAQEKKAQEKPSNIVRLINKISKKKSTKKA